MPPRSDGDYDRIPKWATRAVVSLIVLWLTGLTTATTVNSINIARLPAENAPKWLEDEFASVKTTVKENTKAISELTGAFKMFIEMEKRKDE